MNLYADHKDHFDVNSTTHKAVWSAIATSHKERTGIARTWGQCKSKFHALSRAYKKVKDHNRNTTGEEPRRCPYFDQFEVLLEGKANAEPVIIIDSMRDEPLRVKPVIPCKRSDEKQRSRVTLGDLQEHWKEVSSQAKTQHDEKMEMLGKFLNVFEKSLDKRNS